MPCGSRAQSLAKGDSSDITGNLASSPCEVERGVPGSDCRSIFNMSLPSSSFSSLATPKNTEALIATKAQRMTMRMGVFPVSNRDCKRRRVVQFAAVMAAQAKRVRMKNNIVLESIMSNSFFRHRTDTKIKVTKKNDKPRVSANPCSPKRWLRRIATTV